MALFAANFEKSIVEAVRQAKSNLQPARIGYREGTSYLNVNRDVIDPFTRLWSQAPNYDGPSDKTVAVVKFETLKGEPIAVYYNYAMHSNSMYMSGVISGDFYGETSKYIEEYYDNKIVALWSMSASGDQIQGICSRCRMLRGLRARQPLPRAGPKTPVRLTV